jgi:pimeloyl-ACP methyl ester carboxylesterase
VDIRAEIFRTYCYIPAKAELLTLRVSQEACVNGAKVYELFRQNVLSKPFDLRPKLELLKVDTLVLHGNSDPIPPVTAQNIHKSIPHSKYVLIENCGHFPYVEDPGTYFDLINEFLREK